MCVCVCVWGGGGAGEEGYSPTVYWLCVPPFRIYGFQSFLSRIDKLHIIHINYKSFSLGQGTVYTRVQVERVYKSNPIFEAKNTPFLEKV